jgi:quercetin dioxygenase-like cupin family protein
MIIRKKDIKYEEKEHLRGGRNSVFSGILIEIPLLRGAGRLFSRFVIPPMCEIGYHVHEGDSEAYYILEGSGIYNDNGEETELHEGDVAFTPNGCGHSLYNNTDKNLVMLACVLYDFTKDPEVTKLRTIKRAGTLNKAELHEPFGGVGDFYADKLMEGDEFTGAARLYNVVHLHPGCKLGYHEHNGETEAFYMLKGKAIFCDDGVESEVLPGDVTITPTGHSHSMENRSDEDAVYAAIIYFDKD